MNIKEMKITPQNLRAIYLYWDNPEDDQTIAQFAAEQGLDADVLRQLIGIGEEINRDTPKVLMARPLTSVESLPGHVNGKVTSVVIADWMEAWQPLQLQDEEFNTLVMGNGYLYCVEGDKLEFEER